MYYTYKKNITALLAKKKVEEFQKLFNHKLNLNCQEFFYEHIDIALSGTVLHAVLNIFLRKIAVTVVIQFEVWWHSDTRDYKNIFIKRN